MSVQHPLISLNLIINQTYFSLFKEEDSLKYLANLFAGDYQNHDINFTVNDVPEWKQEVIQDLHKLLKTEDEGRQFGSQLVGMFDSGCTLNEAVTARNFVNIRFDVPEDQNVESTSAS